MRILILLIVCFSLSVLAQNQGISDNWKPTKQEIQVVSIGNDRIIKYIDAIYIDISFPESTNTDLPHLNINLIGQKNHWEAMGINSIYQLNKNGFRIYLYYRDGITPEQAKAWGWKLAWKVLE